MFTQLNRSKCQWIYLLVFLGIFFMPLMVHAVLPPEVYAEQIASSPIKAIAVVSEVNVVSESKYSTSKKVLFMMEKSFGERSPHQFSASCRSIDKSWHEMIDGGAVYYRPQKDDRVFVTVSEFGSLTSYTIMSPELEKELEKNGLKNISFGMSSVGIKVKFQKSLDTEKEKNTDQEEAKKRLAEGRVLWKKGELEMALSTLYGASLYDPFNKQIVKVLKSMELQIEKINELLDRAYTLIRESNYKEAENILKKASLINSQYEAYQRVSQELAEAKEPTFPPHPQDRPEMPTIEKPAIYLYPQEKQKINVSLIINGSMTTSIPPYGEGWSVVADTNGMIDDQYDYLFYENTLNTIELLKEGWIKKGDELDKWFEVILPKLGLNSKEKEQFKEYWLGRLDKDSLYEIKLFSLPFLNKNMTLKIDPSPDTLIRVIFNFKRIEKRYKLQNPVITTPKRAGFHVLEWGGMLE